MNKKLFVVLGALFFAACASNKDVIKIGTIGPLTGDGQSYGQDNLNAIRLRIDEINDAGGVNGKKIELVSEDAKCNGSDATSAAQKLVNIDKVAAILGGVCSSETLAAASVTEPAKMILLSAISTAPAVTDAGDYVFRASPSDANKGRELSKYFEREGYKKIGIITENTDFCQGLRTTVKNTMGSGASLAFDELVDQGTKDYRSLLTRLKDTDFDVIFINGQTDATNVEMVKQARELGIKQPFAGSDTSDSATMGQLAPEAVEGMRVINTSNKLGEGGADSFAAKFRAKYGEPKANLSYATLGYDSAGVLAEALKQVPTLDGAALRDALYNMNYAGAAGTISFDKNGDVVGIGYALKEFRDGKIVEIEDIEISLQ